MLTWTQRVGLFVLRLILHGSRWVYEPPRKLCAAGRFARESIVPKVASLCACHLPGTCLAFAGDAYAQIGVSGSGPPRLYAGEPMIGYYHRSERISLF